MLPEEKRHGFPFFFTFFPFSLLFLFFSFLHTGRVRVRATKATHPPAAAAASESPCSPGQESPVWRDELRLLEEGEKADGFTCQSVGLVYWPHVRERLGEREEEGRRDIASPEGSGLAGCWGVCDYLSAEILAVAVVVVVVVVVMVMVMILSNG